LFWVFGRNYLEACRTPPDDDKCEKHVILFWPIAGLLAAGALAIALGFVPPPHASTLIRVSDGKVRISRGEMRPHAKVQVAEVLSEAGVSRCFIALTPGNRVRFSRGVPSAIHQRLRNIILNQWA
jgi:hypothetical protein